MTAIMSEKTAEAWESVPWKECICHPGTRCKQVPGLSSCDAMTLLDNAAWHPECDLLVTRAPKADRESLTTLVKRFRDERTTWGLKENKE